MSRTAMPGPAGEPEYAGVLAAAELSNAGKKVAILAGQGALRAGTQLEQIAEAPGGDDD